MFFERPDWKLFCDLGTLCQKAGVHEKNLAALVVKEIVDNALDAGAGVTLAQRADGTVLIHDDGPGIPGTNEELATLFSVGRPLTSSKLLRLPTRGALGNGLRVVAGAVLATGGTLIVGTRGRMLRLTPRLDGTTSWEYLEEMSARGTHVAIRFGEALAGQNALWMGNLAVAMRGDAGYTGKSSCWWYDSNAWHNLFLAAGAVPVCDVLAMFDKASKFKDARKLKERSDSLTGPQAEALLAQFRELAPAPNVRALGAVGEGAFRCHGYTKKYGELRLDATRGSYSAVIPVVVECWATKLDEGEKSSCRVYVNRTPITAKVTVNHVGAAFTFWGCNFGYESKVGREPQEIRVSVTAPYMPITSDGKEPDLDALNRPICEAIESATGKAKRATRVLSDEEPIDPMNAIIADLVPEAVEAVSEGHTTRFSLRNLYYEMRTLILATGRKEPSYNYFCTVISEYEGEQGHDIRGMYRDPRGMLIHPHTRERIELGTMNVEGYERPKWRFNKVLYIEKGGFMPILEDNKWAERHDCVIMHAQGQATRAVKDVIDLLGDTLNDEPLEFFCVHDADAYGTMIYEKLVEGSLARGARRVTVHNLGLDPWEALEMGLAPEDVIRKKGQETKRISVASYVHQHRGGWAHWLQKQRVELNAMRPTQLIAWLDEKMERFGGKVIPPPRVLEPAWRDGLKAGLRDGMVDQLLARFRVDERAESLADTAPTPPDLHFRVKDHLAATPVDPWEKGLEPIIDDSVTELLPDLSAE